MLSFISGAEIIFIFFIVLLVFGADRMPQIARIVAKGLGQIRRATEDIKGEMQNAIDYEKEEESITKNIKKGTDKINKTLHEIENSVKRKSNPDG